MAKRKPTWTDVKEAWTEMHGVCGDCGVKEGELHKDGCDMEKCPKCGGQLISCGCYDNCESFSELPFRIPHVDIPIVCRTCGEVWPELFIVPDADWIQYVVPELQKEVLCPTCYVKMRHLFPRGWKRV